MVEFRINEERFEFKKISITLYLALKLPSNYNITKEIINLIKKIDGFECFIPK